MKNKNLLFMALLAGSIISLGSTLAQAQDANNFLSKAKLILKESARKKKLEENLAPPIFVPNIKVETVKNSKFEIKLPLPENVKRIKYLVIKDEDTANYQNVVVDVHDPANFHRSIYLKGSGSFKIRIYSNKYNDRELSTDYNFVKEFQVENVDTRDLTFIGPTDMVQSDAPEIIALAKKITKGAYTDKAIITKIHDYIIKNIKYDHAAFLDKSYLINAYDALSVLHKPLTVCAGYSNFLAALARASGIKTRIINGDVVIDGAIQLHAWNEVYVGGKWEIIDSTYNIYRKDNKYFFIDSEKFAEDHTTTAILTY
jgi:sulfur transfer complex TusBCD TusB component (DsrH family)